MLANLFFVFTMETKIHKINNFDIYLCLKASFGSIRLQDSTVDDRLMEVINIKIKWALNLQM